VNSPDFLGKTPGRRGLNGAGARSDLLRGESTAALDAAQPSAARSEVRFRSRDGSPRTAGWWFLEHDFLMG